MWFENFESIEIWTTDWPTYRENLDVTKGHTWRRFISIGSYYYLKKIEVPTTAAYWRRWTASNWRRWTASNLVKNMIFCIYFKNETSHLKSKILNVYGNLFIINVDSKCNRLYSNISLAHGSIEVLHYIRTPNRTISLKWNVRIQTITLGVCTTSYVPQWPNKSH